VRQRPVAAAQPGPAGRAGVPGPPGQRRRWCRA